MHCNDVNIYLFINGVEIHRFKTKYSEINVVPHYVLVMFQKILQLIIQQTLKLCEYIYDFSVDYDRTNNADTLDIHEHLMFKNNIK